MYKKFIFAALGAILALAIGAAGAYFSAQVQVADSIIKAGTVSVSAEPTTAPLSINSLAPGTTAIRAMKVHNDGDLAADVTVSAAKKAGITEFYEALTCRVTSGGSQLYSGSLSSMQTTPIRMQPGALADLQFEVSLPATSSNSLAEDYARVSLYVDAEQVH